jgi:DmsE family decaheme c-type cytochrome
LRGRENLSVKGGTAQGVSIETPKGKCVRSGDKKSSRLIVWCGGVAALLLGGFVTAAQGLPTDAYHAGRITDPSSAIHDDIHSGGLAHEIANYLKRGAGGGPSLPLQRVAQVQAPSAVQPASYVGQQTCVACHAQESANWAHTVHAKVFELNPRNQLEMQGCEACHGPGSVHVQNPVEPLSIIRFSRRSTLPISEQNGVCLTCHRGGQRIFWASSTHETNDVACSDCHNPMANFSLRGLQARTSINETCFQCHKTQRAEFSRRSHMPLLEGRIACVDCHNPHGSTTEPLLKADSVNEVCFTCHAEKRGPFLFEHAPVRESCVNCHTPHGSNHEKLLVTARPLLCQQCHAQNGHPATLMTRGNVAAGPRPDVRLLSRSCSNCHSQIHGSNHPSGAKFER